MPDKEKDLQAKAEALKKAETKEGSAGVDPAVVALYKKTFADNGGDKDKVCAALGLDSSKWPEKSDEAGFVAKYQGVK